MDRPEMMILVRLKSSLPEDELMRIVDERAPEFAALPGLRQKYYLKDPASGDYLGLYLWESAEALAEFNDSALRASIAAAYQVAEPPEVTVFELMKVLRE